MQILISLIPEPDTISPADKFFAVFDTDTKKLIRMLDFKKTDNSENLTKGTGMCYLDDYWYGASIAKEHRSASRLIIANTKTGEFTINKLNLTKAIHCIYPFGNCGMYNLILANSTQNDIVSIITTYETKVLTEDVFFDFLTTEERMALKWEEEYIYDDSFHNNSIFKYDNKVYVSMFFDYKINGAYKINDKHWRTTSRSCTGAIYDIKNHELIYNNISQPHTVILDSKNDMIVCESTAFKFKNISKNTEAQLIGFTRGICEDIIKGGYWIGISAHRKLCENLKGAAIQFISYNMDVEDPIDLSSLGKEIFEILPFKQGQYFS